MDRFQKSYTTTVVFNLILKTHFIFILYLDIYPLNQKNFKQLHPFCHGKQHGEGGVCYYSLSIVISTTTTATIHNFFNCIIKWIQP